MNLGQNSDAPASIYVLHEILTSSDGFSLVFMIRRVYRVLITAYMLVVLYKPISLGEDKFRHSVALKP